VTSDAQETTNRIRDPRPSYAWAAAWFAIAVLGVVLVVLTLSSVSPTDLKGRSAGLLFGVPIVAIVLGVLILVSALRRRRAWRELVAGTTAEERRVAADADLAQEIWAQPLALGIVVAILWLGAVIVVAVFGAAFPSTALVAAILGLAFVALAWTGLISLGLRRRAAHRRVAASKR
jgi:hypothetical protein